MFGTKQSTTECTALLSHLKGKNFALYHCTEGIEERNRLAFQLISWALATPVLFYSGYPFLSSALRSLRRLTLNMDVLVALGALSAYGYSIAMIFYGGEIFFDTASMIITFILLGRFLEAGSRLEIRLPSWLSCNRMKHYGWQRVAKPAWCRWLRFKALRSCNPGNSLMQKIMALIKAPRSIGAYYPMGIVLGFLPCGLTYTALLAAARAAMEAPHPFAGMLLGALMMMLFGIGTSPALILVGKVVNSISGRMRRWFYRVASVIMIATGVWFEVGGF